MRMYVFKLIIKKTTYLTKKIICQINDDTRSFYCKPHHLQQENTVPKLCTETGSDSVHTFSAACLVILCAFLKSKQTTL